MIGSLFSGISGLNANSQAMSVIGDNIANVNTTGFKSSSVSFGNMFSQSLDESAMASSGSGVKLMGINQIWTSGSFENTGNATDLAINGKGMFVVRNEANSPFYTRAGNFTFNDQGFLVNNDGFNVQGYAINDQGSLDALGDINIAGDNTYKNQATSELTVGLNLNSGAAAGEEYTTTITVNDSLGNNIPLALVFTKVADLNQWTVTTSIPNEIGSATILDSGGDPITFAFDASGKLTNTEDGLITLNLTNGAVSGQVIELNLTENGSSNGNVTGYPSPTMMNSQSQDGYPAGILQSVSVDKFGIVTGSYSNGQRIDLFRVALADFPSYQGLTKIGNNLYTASKHSGQASIGIIGTGRLGNLTPNSLEMSNVDLATEFVKMITTQRAYQANSRVISTSDELLTELINIKR
jgi:flagellar hook protein FlgE